MHLYISEQIRKRYGFGNDFLVGAIMPDIRKLNGEDRDKTHFIVERKKNGVVSRLPEVDDYVYKSKDENNKEMRLGYIAHLIQDNIWFSEFMPNFGEEIGVDSNSDEIYVYPKEGKKIIRTKNEFLNGIYGDYSMWNDKLKKEYGLLNFDEIQNTLNQKINLDENAIKIINNYLQKGDEKDNVFFIKESLMDEYFKKSIEESCKKIDKMMAK